MKTAIYPGTFDPVTLGHLDVIRRGAALFDRLIVGVGDNPEKPALFSLEERLAMLRFEVKRLRGVEVRPFRGLVTTFALECGVPVLLRGARGAADLEYELQMAAANRAAAGVETLLLPPSPAVAFVNARYVREIAAGGGDISPFVTPAVRARLRKRFPPAAGGRS